MNIPESACILVRGTNDIASAVAHTLFLAGYPVAIHEVPEPTAMRRGMSFTDAVFDGTAWLDQVQAVRVDPPAECQARLRGHTSVPVSTADLMELVQALRPDILIDARMRKHSQSEHQRGIAALTVGLGPNFIAGRDVDVAIETAWGEKLGSAVYSGSPAPLTGEPRPLGGHARERYVYAPASGIFRSNCSIGDAVTQGKHIATLGNTPILAPLTGSLRGLTRDGVFVQERTKVIEVDPRGPMAVFYGITERPARIAQGLLEVASKFVRGPAAHPAADG